MDLRPLLSMPLLDARFPLPLDRPFTSADAQQEGVTSRNLTALVGSGHLRRPVRGVFVAAQVADSVGLRCAVLRLVVPADAVICDRHAGWLHGAQMILAPGEHLDLRPISVFLPPGRRLRNELSDSGERGFSAEDVVEIDGVRVTSLLRTALDLGRVRSRDAAMSGLDSMVRLGVDRDELVAAIPRFKGMRWVTTLRAVTPYADPRSASPGESALKLRFLDACGELPDLQIQVWREGRLLAILDLGRTVLRYSAEYDGAEWHTSDEQREHDTARRADAACEGWIIDPLTKVEVYGRNQTAIIRIREGLAKARRRFGLRAA